MVLLNQDLSQNSRSGLRSKRRKTNLILNSLIIIVLLLIIIVAFKIFASGGDEKVSAPKTDPKMEEKQAVHKEKEEQASSKEENTPADETAADEEKQTDEEGSEQATTATEQEDDSQAVVTDGGGSSNIIRTIENPAWKPVGTSQTGEHTPVYEKESVDWQEMLNAISYATGLDPGNMTVYWLGRDKSAANSSIGTVYSKDQQEKYRVYITWVDGDGWMPTKVEELKELEK